MSCPFCKSKWKLCAFTCGTYIPEDNDMGDELQHNTDGDCIKYSKYVRSEKCKRLEEEATMKYLMENFWCKS